MKRLSPLLIFLFVFSIGLNTTAQSASGKLTKHEIKKWFNKKDWLGGLKIKPQKTINKSEFFRQYHLNKSFWDKAFAFLREHDLQALPVGRTTIDGDNVYALVTQNPTKNFDSTTWESHRKYVDLQYVISGEEKIGITPLENVTETKPYDASKDLINYTGNGKFYHALPQVFFLFFPTDAHRPNLTLGGNKPDKKVVIKIMYTVRYTD